MYTSFSEVTAALSKKLHDLKYSDGTIQKYEREWTRFENYLSKNNIEQYDMETVKDPLEFPEKLSPHCLRHTKAMMLLEMNQTGILTSMADLS